MRVLDVTYDAVWMRVELGHITRIYAHEMRILCTFCAALFYLGVCMKSTT